MTDTSSAMQNAGLSPHAERWTLVATITASGLSFVAGSILNLASVPLKNELGADGVDLLWMVNIFTLFLAALILIGGSLGDHFGRKRVFGIGIAVFGLASVACGFATSVEFMIFGRAIQGIGGALMVPGSLAIISASFSDARRGPAIGLWSALGTVSGVIGPVVGGFLVDQGLWRGLYFINVPVVLLALYALRFVPESRDENAPAQLDYLGAGLITVSLAAMTYGALTASSYLTSQVILCEFSPSGAKNTASGSGLQAADSQLQALLAVLVGFVALAAFVVVELRSSHPLVKPVLFRSRTFTGTNLMTLLLYAGLAGTLFFVPLNLVDPSRRDEWPSGLLG